MPSFLHSASASRNASAAGRTQQHHHIHIYDHVVATDVGAHLGVLLRSKETQLEHGLAGSRSLTTFDDAGHVSLQRPGYVRGRAALRLLTLAGGSEGGAGTAFLRKCPNPIFFANSDRRAA